MVDGSSGINLLNVLELFRLHPSDLQKSNFLPIDRT
jgi:hypothetical protein